MLRLEDALAAVQTHPQLRVAEAAALEADARADQSRSALLPSVGGRASYGLSTVTGSSLSAQLSGSALIWDFGQSRQTWLASASGADARAAMVQDVLLQLRLTVYQAYFTAVATQTLVGVAQQALDNQLRHAAQVAAFVAVGSRAEVDLAIVQTQVANARVVLLQAQNAEEVGRAQLALAMGVDHLDLEVSDTPFPAVVGEEEAVEALLGEAWKARPEAMVLQYQLEGAAAAVRATKAGYAPALSVSGAVGEAGAPGALGASASAGVALDVPLFQGLSLKAQQAAAEAVLSGLQAQEDLLRQQLRVEIVQAQRSVSAGKAILEASQEAVAAARRQSDQAERRYATGAGSALELEDAQLALSNALAQEVRAVYGLASARALLLAALGRV